MVPLDAANGLAELSPFISYIRYYLMSSSVTSALKVVSHITSPEEAKTLS